MSATPTIIVAFGLVGACLGSFAATAAVRTLREEPFIGGRSHCDACDEALGFVATVPVLSYALRRGRCGACGAPIDAVHLFGELAGAFIVASAVLVAPPLRAGALACLGLVLVTSAIIDAKSQRLPDVLTLVVAALATILAFQRGVTQGVIGLASGLICAALLEGVRRGFQRLRGASGLGFGDVKLASALAIWLGVATPWAVVAGSILGLGYMLMRPPASGRVAFGPALAAGGIAVGFVREGVQWLSR